MLMANGRSVTHIRTAPAPSFSSYVCPLSMRMRTHVFFGTLTTSLYGDLMSAITFCTADIHERVVIGFVFVGAGAVRGPVAAGVGVAMADDTTGICVCGIGAGGLTEESFAVTWLNLAITAIGPEPDSVQRPRPEHAPAQPSNREPGAGVAARLRGELVGELNTQPLPHWIPVGLLTTVPAPSPPLVTTSVNIGTT